MEESSKLKNAGARRSKRVNLAMPVVLRGVDNSGVEFEESTRTVVISKHGAKIRTVQSLDLGAVISIENRSMGLAANATVVSVGPRQFPGEPVEIGVQLNQAGNVWGIIFPPDDWEAGPALAVEGGDEVNITQPAEAAPVEAAPASAVESPPPITPAPPVPNGGTASSAAASAAPPSTATPVVSATPPPASPPPAGPSPGKIDALTAAVLARLTKQLDEATDARLKAYGEKVIRFTNQFALRVQANFQDAANRTEDQMVALIQQKLGTLADRVQGSRSILESLLARFEALQQNSSSLVEETERRIREASRLALESSLQDLAVNLRQRVDRLTASLQSESQALVRDAVTKSVNATLERADQQLAVQTRDRLAKVHAELKWQQEQMIDGVKEQFNQLAVTGTTTMTAKLEAIAGEVVPAAHGELERSIRETAGKVAAETAQSLQEQSRLLSQDALVSLQQAVQSLQDRMQEESRKIRQSSEQEMAKTADAFSQTVAQRADLAIGSVQSAVEQGTTKLGDAQQESVRSLRTSSEEYQRQLAGQSGTVLESFQTALQNHTRELQEEAAQLFAQKLQCLAEEITESSVEKIRQRLPEEAAATAEALSSDAKKRLSAMAEEFFAASAQELKDRLRSQAESQLEAVLQSAPEKFNERLGELTRKAEQTLVKVTGRELHKLARNLFQTSSEVLRKDVEQLTSSVQNDLKAYQATLSDESRKELVGLSRSTVRTLNGVATAGLEEFCTRLHKAAQDSHDGTLRELDAHFQQALEKQRASVSELLGQQAEQSRNSAELQIKAVSDQIIAKAAETIEQHVATSARRLTELGEQARSGTEQRVQKIDAEAETSLAKYERQIEQSTNAALDKFRKDTGILLEEVAFRLQQSVRSFQSSTGNEILSELQKASDNLLEVSAAQMRKQTEQTLELITERLKQKEEEVVSDAANVFRSRIADIFAILQEGSRKTPDPAHQEQLNRQG
jgi:hypothetical protein